MVLLAVFSFRMCECDNKYKHIISFAIYGILATTALLFIHNNAILKTYNKRSSSDDARAMFNPLPPILGRPGPSDVLKPAVSNDPFASPVVKTTGRGEDSLDKFMSELE